MPGKQALQLIPGGSGQSGGESADRRLSGAVLPPHTQPLTADGTGYSNKRVAPRIGPVLRTNEFDRVLHAAIGRMTGGVAPTAIALAWVDWWWHLQIQPGKMHDLAQSAVAQAGILAAFATRCALFDGGRGACAERRHADARFRREGWATFPFNLQAEAFLLGEEWWQQATTTVQGVSQHHRDLLAFLARQVTDFCSPSNFPWSNPEVMRYSIEQHGRNLLQGLSHAAEDVARHFAHQPPVGAERFKPGEAVALTPGQVIYRNKLIELIQYQPQTAEVWREPVLIVPAWIMKYYILDLSPGNSLVRYLVSRGHTVFMISWVNPGKEDASCGMDDYRRLGVMEALAAVATILPEQKIHTVGYCLGGTLLALAAAAMARDGDERLASMTLLAAQIDFEEAGELMLFIDEAQLTFLENLMSQQGCLEKGQLSAAFNLLRSKDLIWSRVTEEYLRGERQPMFDLMAWSADSTRLPFRMHSEYLRSMFLNNDLTEGRYMVNGEGISVTDISVPVFAVGTEKDHIAPWRSVFKIHLYGDTDITFILTAGGHNAGIISEPGRTGRSFRMTFHDRTHHYIHPQRWYDSAPVFEGSWWPAWEDWLARHSGGKTAPPAMGAPEDGLQPLTQAPGTYVHIP